MCSAHTLPRRSRSGLQASTTASEAGLLAFHRVQILICKIRTKLFCCPHQSRHSLLEYWWPADGLLPQLPSPATPKESERVKEGEREAKTILLDLSWRYRSAIWPQDKLTLPLLFPSLSHFSTLSDFAHCLVYSLALGSCPSFPPRWQPNCEMKLLFKWTLPHGQQHQLQRLWASKIHVWKQPEWVCNSLCSFNSLWSFSLSFSPPIPEKKKVMVIPSRALINELNRAGQAAQVLKLKKRQCTELRRGSNASPEPHAPLLLAIDWMSCSC